MAQVPEKVLAWLYNVLHEYRDAQRTYSDAARTLSAYPSLSPRTEVFTYENGSSVLLLTLSGTLPVAFRGTTYRFPIKLWVPLAFPQEPPFVFVTPGKDMLVRPGQHVGVDGRVYHPYLRDWSRMWDRASMGELLEYLQQAFAKEPPVISKAQQQQYQRAIGSQQQQQPHPTSAGQIPPQLPPKQQPGSTVAVEMPSTSTPPPRPPKPGDERATSSTAVRDVARDGPPLPPLPSGRPQSMHYVSPPPQQPLQNYVQSQNAPPEPYPQSRAYQRTVQPYPAGQAGVQQQQYTHPSVRHASPYEEGPVSPIQHVNGFSGPADAQFNHQSALSHRQAPAFHPLHVRPDEAALAQRQQQRAYQSGPQASIQHQGYIQPAQAVANTQPQPMKQPPPDLLSDPFDIALPSLNSGPPPPAPPIPPNPEKEHLLHAISATLVQQAQQRVYQNLSALAPLQAQQNAIRAAHSRLESELDQLQALDKALTSNEDILHRSIQDCDRTIQTARSKKQPPIDDVLVAPTLVAQQLWTLCAEEAACREAMYVLQKAVDRGRVSGSDFVRQMRGLGRECFLKMLLARKCAKGLGLELEQ